MNQLKYVSKFSVIKLKDIFLLAHLINTLVNVYVDLLVFTRIAGTS